MVLLALTIAAVGGGDSGSGHITGPLPAITAEAPPHAAAMAAPCARVLAELPLQLGALKPRVVHTHPDTPNVVAWGDPAVVLSCGVARPADLRPGSTAQYFTNGPAAGPFYTVTPSGDANAWTTVDREPYIEITVPAQYQGGNVLPPLSRAIAKALPAVCSTDPAAPVAKRCTRRP